LLHLSHRNFWLRSSLLDLWLLLQPPMVVTPRLFCRAASGSANRL
jgi:hypothetical protein